MRDIKFRGQRHNGCWVYGDLCMPANRFASIRVKDGVSYDEYEVIGETIGQFTGMIDKKKKEIYEGDIVIFRKEIYEGDIVIFREDINDAIIFQDKGIVKYRPDYATFVLHSNTGDEMMGFYEGLIEVIGNIFDNKDLLEDNQ